MLLETTISRVYFSMHPHRLSRALCFKGLLFGLPGCLWVKTWIVLQYLTQGGKQSGNISHVNGNTVLLIRKAAGRRVMSSDLEAVWPAGLVVDRRLAMVTALSHKALAVAVIVFTSAPSAVS